MVHMIKLIKGFVAVVMAVVFIAPALSLAATKAVGSGPNPYRDCGIGAALFPETHWAAVISNATWDLGTTAVTSATSSPETCSGANVQTAQFIIDHYDNLVEETAKGQGEYLTAVLDIQGCDTRMQPGAIESIRTEMAENVGSKAYSGQDQVEKATDYYNAVGAALSSSCSS